MAQIFSARTDRRLRRLLLALPVLFIVLLALGFYQFRSSAHWGVGGTADQPIGFRHDIHVSELGLDCGFCHTGAEHEAAAGMPSASTCLVCHSQVWRGVEALRPLFTSIELDQPIEWKSLYRLPGHTRFHHGAHAASRVACAACHGDVATMVKTEKAEPMSMAWCLDWHRQVGERRQRKRIEALFSLGHTRESGSRRRPQVNPASPLFEARQEQRDSRFRGSDGSKALAAEDIAFASPRLTDCSTCHY